MGEGTRDGKGCCGRVLGVVTGSNRDTMKASWEMGVRWMAWVSEKKRIKG